MEIGHARIWLAIFLERMSKSLVESERDAIRAYLPIAFEHLVAHEHAHLPERGARRAAARLWDFAAASTRGRSFARRSTK